LRAEGEGKAGRTELERRYCEAMRGLVREMTAHFGLIEDDMPKPAKVRMAK